jgi:hypothetical protein
LYSKNNLDINGIIAKIEGGTGDFNQRLKDAVKNINVDNENIKYSYDNEIKFNAKSRGKSVVAILVEIPKPYNK